MDFRLCDRDVPKVERYLGSSHTRYILYFRTKTRNVMEQSFQYLQALLLQRGRGNMSKYARNVPESSSRRLTHFISDSPWDYEPVIANIQRDIIDAIGYEREGSIHIDETGFPKQGNDSVGVKRQYCGRLGKVENCQVAVFLGYSNGPNRSLLDMRLYIPADWANDPVRRSKCGIPEDIEFKTKSELGLEMILNARNNGLPFGWVGMDTFYGRQSKFRDAIADEGLIYIADIPSDTRVWLALPETGIPERKGQHGRLPEKVKVLDGEPSPMKVSEIKNNLDPSQWKRTFVRDTERMQLWARFACLRVFPVVDGLPGNELWLIIRINGGDKETKYQVSNAPLDTSLDRFAKMSCSRYWIERSFQDGKGLTGLADFQGRSWTGWHHHITMALLAMMVLLMIRRDLGKAADLLTVQDVKDIYELSFARRKYNSKEVVELIRKKHKAREFARLSHHRVAQQQTEH